MKLSAGDAPIWTFSPSSHIEQPVHREGALVRHVRETAARVGLMGVGFAPAAEFRQAEDALQAWLAAGHHGTMDYLAAATRSDPHSLYASACTLVVAAAPYCAEPAESPRLPLMGHIAGYAHGPDYHGSLRRSLAILGQSIADYLGRSINARACVDTAPLLEREAARLAGLGFIGKSNMLIVPGVGSRVMLGALLVDIEIAADTPQAERCGTCNACLQACPTRAFVGPWLLDARRCISYLTIEYQGWIPLELRPLIGTRVFGCDVCQDVCPFNRGQLATSLIPASISAPSDGPRSLHSWLALSSSDYRRLTSGSALRRTSRAQLLRNAAVAAGNSGDATLVPALADLAQSCRYAIVRGHAAWALGQLGGTEALDALQVALAHEADPLVEQELTLAINRLTTDTQL